VDIVTQEALAWMRAADVAGVELPDEVQEARERLEKIDGEIAALPKPSKVPTAAQMVAEGVALKDVGVEAQKLADEAARLEETHRVARAAQHVARRTLSRLVAEQRDALIVGARTVVRALVDEARPHAEALAPFAPKYDAGAIVRRAEQKQIKAWREAEELERRFGSIMAAWRSSFKATNARGSFASPSKVSGFDVRWMDQVHRYWERPEVVGNPRLNGTHLGRRGYPLAIEPTVLGVASEPAEAGFRLCTMRELKELYDAMRQAQAAAARGQFPRRSGRAMSI
jgi:hypothetical protein